MILHFKPKHEKTIEEIGAGIRQQIRQPNNGLVSLEEARKPADPALVEAFLKEQAEAEERDKARRIAEVREIVEHGISFLANVEGYATTIKFLSICNAVLVKKASGKY